MMESGTELELCHSYPIIYKVEMEQGCFEQILHDFVVEILQNTSCSKVEAAIMNYITRVIEPVGWDAVWRATKESSGFDTECDFIVEVQNVSLVKLEADVIIKSIVVAYDTSDSDVCAFKNKFKTIKWYTVPLIELFPISEGDDEEEFAKTAVAIEHARFFYKHLSRPWDGEEDDTVYSEKLLRPRLQLYFDIQNKVLPEVMITKIRTVLKEGCKIMIELNRLYSEMNVSDSEAELNEDDVLKSLELRKKLEQMQRKMEILENPVIRTLIMKKQNPYKSPLKQQQQRLGPCTYIVAKQFTYEMIVNLNLEPSTILQFHHCPEHVLKSCSNGDTVLISPGHYRCDTLGWLEGDIVVKGLGTNGSVTLEATGNSEVFLNCDSSSLYLHNLILKATPGLVSTIVVHHGKVDMKDCVILSDGAETGITVLGGAEVTMDESEVSNSKGDGIQLRSSSVLTLKSCKVISCGRHGIQLDVDEESILAGRVTEIYISDSYIVSNDGSGIYVNNAPMNEISLEKTDGDFSVLKLFPWLKHSIENTLLSHNKEPEVGMSSACKSIKNLISQFNPISPVEKNTSFDLGSPMLDDILSDEDIELL